MLTQVDGGPWQSTRHPEHSIASQFRFRFIFDVRSLASQVIYETSKINISSANVKPGITSSRIWNKFTEIYRKRICYRFGNYRISKNWFLDNKIKIQSSMPNFSKKFEKCLENVDNTVELLSNTISSSKFKKISDFEMNQPLGQSASANTHTTLHVVTY